MKNKPVDVYRFDKNNQSLWLDGVRRVESPNCDKRPVDAQIDLLVIHAISLPPGEFGGPYVDQLFTNTLDLQQHDYFKEIAALRVSAHLFIDRQGCLTQYVPLDKRAWHAGESNHCGRTACNDFSIGIELEGCDELSFTDKQYQCLGHLSQFILNHWPQIGKDQIVGHSDIAPGRKTDPGPCFDWDRYFHAFDV